MKSRVTWLLAAALVLAGSAVLADEAAAMDDTGPIVTPYDGEPLGLVRVEVKVRPVTLQGPEPVPPPGLKPVDPLSSGESQGSTTSPGTRGVGTLSAAGGLGLGLASGGASASSAGPSADAVLSALGGVNEALGY